MKKAEEGSTSPHPQSQLCYPETSELEGSDWLTPKEICRRIKVRRTTFFAG